MRQYRAIPIDGKDFVYGWYVEVGGISYIIPPEAYTRVFPWRTPDKHCQVGVTGFVEVIPETVGQSTGPKDKKGKDIYEGDICKETQEHITNGKPSEDGWTSATLPIEFHSGMFTFGYHTNDLTYFVKCWGLKIIGDIHTTPELLEKTK